MASVMLMPKLWVDTFRSGGRNEQGNLFERGVATGKACCRACGQRVAKGETALVGYFDFTQNYGSWTSVRVWLHEAACNEEQQ